MADIGYLKNKEDIRLYLSSFYPVGAIYISAVECNPEEMFGGKWEVFATGRTLVGIDTSQIEFNTALKTGGAKTHKLTTAQLPAHTHSIKSGYGAEDGQSYDSYRYQYWGHQNNGWKSGNLGTGSTGENQAHNNLQPYITVYMYRRIS